MKLSTQMFINLNASVVKSVCSPERKQIVDFPITRLKFDLNATRQEPVAGEWTYYTYRLIAFGSHLQWNDWNVTLSFINSFAAMKIRQLDSYRYSVRIRCSQNPLLIRFVQRLLRHGTFYRLNIVPKTRPLNVCEIYYRLISRFFARHVAAAVERLKSSIGDEFVRHWISGDRAVGLCEYVVAGRLNALKVAARLFVEK